MLRRIEPYWYAIGLVLAAAAAVFGYHLATGVTPPRAAVSPFGVPIYWYGIWIVTGVALGAWVVARLAEERARRVFAAAVPAELRVLPLAGAGLSDDVLALLARRKLSNLGDALYEVGLDTRRLGLKPAETEQVVAALVAVPGVAPSWTSDAPWRYPLLALKPR